MLVATIVLIDQPTLMLVATTIMLID